MSEDKPDKKSKEIKVDLSLGRQARIAGVVGQLQDAYGDILGPGSSMRLTPDIRRISTGSLSLDYILGGGIPEGRITMFIGRKGSGKTTHALRVVAAAQGLCRRCMRPARITDVVPIGADGERCAEDEAASWKAIGECDCGSAGISQPPPGPKGEKKKDAEARLEAFKANSYEEMICAWIDAEMAMEWGWATRLGVDPRRLIYSRPETGEEGVDTIDPLLRTGAVDLLVLDSIAHLIASDEVKASAYDSQQAVQARLVNKGVRRFVSAMAMCANQFGRVPTQIWINQERQKLGPFPGTVNPGGRGQGFAASIEVNCWASKLEVDKINAGNKGEEIMVPRSEELHFSCEKNKVFSRGAEGFYRQFVSDVDGRLGQIDERDQIHRYAGYFGIVKRDEKSLTCTLDGFECARVGDMQEHLDTILPRVKAEILRILLLRAST